MASARDFLQQHLMGTPSYEKTVEVYIGAQQDQKRIHFGLAQNEKVSELAVHWPSGIVQKLTDVPVNQVLHVIEEGVQTSLPGDVNQDGQVDILDLLLVVVYFGESPPTDARVDTNKDGQVNLEDLVRIIEIIEENQNGAAAPTLNAISNRISTLSDADIDLLYAFYQKIEEISEDITQIERVRRFLSRLLMPVEGPLQTKLHANYPNPFKSRNMDTVPTRGGCRNYHTHL